VEDVQKFFVTLQKEILIPSRPGHGVLPKRPPLRLVGRRVLQATTFRMRLRGAPRHFHNSRLHEFEYLKDED
jgi:hypothetical protein